MPFFQHGSRWSGKGEAEHTLWPIVLHESHKTYSICTCTSCCNLEQFVFAWPTLVVYIVCSVFGIVPWNQLIMTTSVSSWCKLWTHTTLVVVSTITLSLGLVECALDLQLFCGFSHDPHGSMSVSAQTLNWDMRACFLVYPLYTINWTVVVKLLQFKGYCLPVR